MWDALTVEEAGYTRRAIEALSSKRWARLLLHRVELAGGVTASAKPLLFEVRYAHELLLAGVTPEYERAAGVGNSTVEFRIPGDPEWLVELVSLRESEALRASTHERGSRSARLLWTGSPDRRQSEEGEMIKAEERIVEKVFSSGRPTKFPPPRDGAIHLVLADMRGYLGYGGDEIDYAQMALGEAGVPRERAHDVHCWEKEGKLVPIAGLFEECNPLPAAQLVRERIHFLGFVAEREYREGEIRDTAYHLANPHLFADEDAAERAFLSYPLAPKRRRRR